MPRPRPVLSGPAPAPEPPSPARMLAYLADVDPRMYRAVLAVLSRAYHMTRRARLLDAKH